MIGEVVLTSKGAEKRLALEPKSGWSKRYTKHPATGELGEKELCAALSRLDSEASDIYSPAHPKQVERQKASYSLPEAAGGFHIRGERFHRLDGLWRFDDGHYLLFEAKGPVHPKEARHTVEKLNHWMKLANGKDDVVRAWMLDWLFIQRDIWAAPQRVRQSAEASLDDAIASALKRRWSELESSPPDVVVLCSKITKDAAKILRGFFDEWGSGLASAKLWIVREDSGPELKADEIPFSALPSGK